MPKVSVIVPNFNNASYLDRCLSSLSNQTEKSIEFILVDDASYDHSFQVMKKYRKDPRFKLYHFPINQGVSIARNFGISKATGDYIGFVDSDDFISENYFQVLKESLERTNLPLACSGDLSGEEYTKQCVVDFREKEISLLTGGPSSCTHLFRRDLIEKDRFIEGCRLEDSAFTILMHMKSGKLVLAPSAKYFYFIGNKNSYGNQERSPQDVLDLLRVNTYLKKQIQKKKDLSIYEKKYENTKAHLLAPAIFWIADSSYLSSCEKQDLLLNYQVLLQKECPNFEKEKGLDIYMAQIVLSQFYKEELFKEYEKKSLGVNEKNFKKKMGNFQTRYGWYQ